MTIMKGVRVKMRVPWSGDFGIGYASGVYPKDDVLILPKHQIDLMRKQLLLKGIDFAGPPHQLKYYKPWQEQKDGSYTARRLSDGK